MAADVAIQRLELAFQAYSLALEAVQLTKRQRYPDLPTTEFNWRVIRRMQGNQNLGKEKDGESSHPARTKWFFCDSRCRDGTIENT